MSVRIYLLLPNDTSAQQILPASEMIDVMSFLPFITPYLVWLLVKNQEATDTHFGLSPVRASILQCQVAANVLAANGKQATRFKLTAECYYTEHLVMNERIAH